MNTFYIILSTVCLIGFGYILGWLGRPKLYHGHFTPVPKGEEPKEEAKPNKVDIVNRAFDWRRN